MISDSGLRIADFGLKRSPQRRQRNTKSFEVLCVLCDFAVHVLLLLRELGVG